MTIEEIESKLKDLLDAAGSPIANAKEIDTLLQQRDFIGYEFEDVDYTNMEAVASLVCKLGQKAREALPRVEAEFCKDTGLNIKIYYQQSFVELKLESSEEEIQRYIDSTLFNLYDYEDCEDIESPEEPKQSLRHCKDTRELEYVLLLKSEKRLTELVRDENKDIIDKLDGFGEEDCKTYIDIYNAGTNMQFITGATLDNIYIDLRIGDSIYRPEDFSEY